MSKEKEQVKSNEFSEIQKHLRVLDQKINTYLADGLAPDILIIKAHLICEHYINQILLVKEVCSSKEIRDLSFFEKLQKSFDLNNPIEKVVFNKLQSLNKLRNKTGHELEYTLSESDVDELGYIDGREYVIQKYDFENIQKTLRYILVTIVIDTSFILFDLIKKIKIQESSKVNTSVSSERK